MVAGKDKFQKMQDKICKKVEVHRIFRMKAMFFGRIGE